MTLPRWMPTFPGKFVLALALSCPLPGWTQSAPPKNLPAIGQSGVKGAVCTIYASRMNWLRLHMEVSLYSTFKVEDSCDPSLFERLSLASIHAQMRGIQASSNTTAGGIHHHVMDVNLTAVPNPFYMFGDIKFSKIGTVAVSLSEMLSGNFFRFNPLEIFKRQTLSVRGMVSASYTPMSLYSDTFYIWNIGSLVHHLVSPSGDKYIMFSYTNRVVPDLTRDGLVDLGPLLNHPPGWKYESFLLDRTITVRATEINGYKNTLLFDELENFYIKYSD